MAKLKAYKIQDVSRRKRVGVVAKSFADLKENGVKKLALPGESKVFLEDGTEVEDDEYFQSLPSQSVLVFVRPDESWDGYLTVLKHATEKIFKAMSRRDEIIEQVHEFIHGSDSDEMYCIMVELVNRLDDNIDADERHEDETWFDGLSQSFNTKEDAMRNSAKSRVRKYFSNAKEFFDQKTSKRAQSLLTSVLEQFQEELKKQRYFGDYFARSASPKLRLCCPKGWFNCEGPYNEEDCVKLHKINPYGSKESRVLFSTWNLDHVIEKSRQVLPTMIRAAEDCPKGHQLNWKYFFDLLFTRKNLKLVHVGCHIKGEHEGYECQARYFYVKSRR